jgi:hypothetical protein
MQRAILDTLIKGLLYPLAAFGDREISAALSSTKLAHHILQIRHRAEGHCTKSPQRLYLNGNRDHLRVGTRESGLNILGSYRRIFLSF